MGTIAANIDPANSSFHNVWYSPTALEISTCITRNSGLGETKRGQKNESHCDKNISKDAVIITGRDRGKIILKNTLNHDAINPSSVN